MFGCEFFLNVSLPLNQPVHCTVNCVFIHIRGKSELRSNRRVMKLLDRLKFRAGFDEPLSDQSQYDIPLFAGFCRYQLRQPEAFHGRMNGMDVPTRKGGFHYECF